MSETKPATSRTAPALFGCVLLACGLALAIGGAMLVKLGGSGYYLIAGITCLISGFFFLRGRRSGFWVFSGLFVGTLLWALNEVGLQFWPLIPRLSGVFILAIPALLLAPRLQGKATSARQWYVAASVMTIAVIAGFAAMFSPHGLISNPGEDVITNTADNGISSDWSAYGKSPSGTRFVTAEQIDKKNVGHLKVAWTFRTGELPINGSENQNTPLQVGDTLYVCTPLNQVIAINADTGEERWRFNPEVKGNGKWQRCRGVSYFDSATNSSAVASASEQATSDQSCSRRIFTSTVDGRLIALDAATGRQCESFGEKGVVNLKQGLGEIKNAFYVPTSAPTVGKGLVMVGGWVYDNQEVNEPSGAFRAYDARTGKIAWAWDVGNPNLQVPPPADYLYTRGTPNVWSTPAVDEKLGLVYLPTGNATPDYYGAKRRDFDEANSSSIVALDIATGKVAWKFQTVHHDLWDYDVPAQPALVDLPGALGVKVPALVQVTKRGQIFVLNRQTGVPVRKVEERPVPQGAAPGDFVSATQPYSTEMPVIGTKRLVESDMWGATIFDQMLCRITFKSVRYDGEFTPPRPDSTGLQFAGNYGGMNWGSASVNEDTGTLIVNDIRLPLLSTLVTPRALGESQSTGVHDGKNLYSPQSGLPYAVVTSPFMSPLGIPCIAPPFGTISAVDLHTGQLRWQRPAGTVSDTRLADIRLGMPVPLGMPTLGGPFTTRSGLVFHSGTQDYFLRAYDQASGDELWKAPLPVGSQATPMSYVSPKTGKQYVVVTAGGSRQSPDRGDYIIAYSLPGKALK
ncbi:membrane-bound PQQ-dependent dehydrogenase, glucose/quinate/shikimate family [Pseudomonas sp. v388]|uniref:membrane-bound PQQ-dependent dehydrogenase, glucose/quinate/shikimate family n=1 Tax=Pseudomonas sp. v388 TaxID=2479849 RepID=UPI000F7ABD3D|nr:membrane-bound PQQ-dependent dehydrogenase, glucose/quinate/shikimate family [Pseudomonas sp. v388]RRV10506.1 membrane-bound PQQ-dependent dehydrogenase, glucose/quinate/shikimate family [Pseudomonas sp. v388]